MNLANPVVSVLCAAYNQKDFLEDAMKGILNQRTNFPFELVVNDDASTDGTEAVIRDYEAVDRRVRVIYQTENQFSQGRTPREFLMPAARGEFFAWCEGDDVWTDPLKLQKQVDLLQANRHLAGCYTEHSFIDLNGNPLRVDRKPELRKSFTHLGVLRSGCPKTLTLMLRREALLYLIKNLNCFRGLKNGDQLICAFATQYGDIAYLPEITGSYRVGSGFWSTMRITSQSSTLIESFLRMAEFFDSPEEKHAIADRLTKRMALIATLGGKKNQAWAQEIQGKMFDLGLNFDPILYQLEKRKLFKNKLRRCLGRFLRLRSQ